MPELAYRTEEDRLAGKDTAGDPFKPQTEADRVAEAAKDLPRPSAEYPRWIEPHKSRVESDPVTGAPHVPGFQSFVRRFDKLIQVLVNNAAEEKIAVSETDAARLEREAKEAAEAEKRKEQNPT